MTMKIGRFTIARPYRVESSSIGFLFDGDDEPGDPSGINAFGLGWSLGVYWPMHRRMWVSWFVGDKLQIVRW